MNTLYDIYVNIGDWDNPVVGSGYVKSIYNHHSELTFKNESEDIVRNRVKVDGKIIFYSEEYDVLKALEPTTYHIELRIDEKRIVDTTTTYTYSVFSKLQLRGNFKDTTKLITNKIISIDGYTKLLDDPVTNIETEFQIKGKVAVSSVDCVFTSGASGTSVFDKSYSIREIIEYIVTDIDNTIIFDVDSFEFFDKVGNEDIKYLYMSSMYDVSNELFNSPKLLPKSSVKINLKDLFDYFEETFSAYWYITSSNEFRFIHVSDYIRNVGIDFDFTSNEYNRFLPQKEYEYQTNKVSLISRKTREDNPSEDFDGLDIMFQQLPEFRKEEINLKYYTDIDSIKNDEKQIDSGFCVFACEYVESQFDVDFEPGRYVGADPGFDSMDWDMTTLIISNSTSGVNRFCYSLYEGVITTGDLYSFKFNVTDMDGALVEAKIYGYSSSSGSVLLKTRDIISLSGYDIIFTCPEDFDCIWLEFGCSGEFSMTANNFDFSRGALNCEKATGVLSSQEVLNANVSIGNIDEKYFANATEKIGSVNGVQRTDLYKINDKKIIQINIPLRPNFNTIDFTANHTLFGFDAILINHERSFDNNFDSLDFLINDNI